MIKFIKKKKRSLSSQINALIVIGVLAAGIVTYFLEYAVSVNEVKKTLQKRAAEAVLELSSAVKEYPAYEWLLTYWQENADSLDIEYDADFESDTATGKKRALFGERHPDLQVRYCTRDEVLALSDEDQKLFAEIAYSWILTRINETKSNLGCDFLSLFATGTESSDHPYETQFYLMSGADPDSARGTDYGDSYTLGVTVPVPEGSAASSIMQKAVKDALEDALGNSKAFGEDLKDAGNYLDFYKCLALIGDQAIIAGVSYSRKALLWDIRFEVIKNVMLAAFCQLLLLGIVMRHLSLYVIRPLKKILSNIRMYSETRSSAAVEKNMNEILAGTTSMATRENEIGQLAEDFADLTKEIDDFVEQIKTATSQQERYRTEMNIAAQIQAQVLPNKFPAFPDREEFDLYATMTPAREVGGDFYDFFFTDQNHLALVIGDVSDKGVPAALFMMMTKTLIENHAKMGESPAEVVAHVNDQLSENNEAGYFVTVWIALIDVATGKGVSVNAGHEHPSVCKAGGVYELIRYRHSPAIGTMSGIRYRQHEFQMGPGDKLFVYTDGVPEATNIDNEQFGTDRMLEALNHNREADPKKLLINLKEEIDAFAGDAPQFDDTTMLSFHLK